MVAEAQLAGPYRGGGERPTEIGGGGRCFEFFTPALFKFII